MKLYGSIASPYVRRLRLLMADISHTFIVVDVYNDKDRAMLLEHNPTLKIPMLDDEGQIVLDSRVIFQYLVDKGFADSLNLSQQNLLTSIDAANDSLVNLFLLKRSGIEKGSDTLYFKLQLERLQAVFTHLNKVVESGDFARWDFLSMSLFAMLDWIAFRDLYDMKPYAKLRAFHAKHSEHKACKLTNPR